MLEAACFPAVSGTITAGPTLPQLFASALTQRSDSTRQNPPCRRDHQAVSDSHGFYYFL
jgi:hypothetical protein